MAEKLYPVEIVEHSEGKKEVHFTLYTLHQSYAVSFGVPSPPSQAIVLMILADFKHDQRTQSARQTTQSRHF